MNMVIIAGAAINANKRRKQQQKIQQQSMTRLKRLMNELKQKIKCQTLLKRSKHLKKWRIRKLIITPHMIGTFQEKGDKMHATQWIDLTSIESCVNPVLEKNDPQGNFLFSFYGKDKKGIKQNFRFACQTKEQRDHWIEIVKYNSPNCKK